MEVRTIADALNEVTRQDVTDSHRWGMLASAVGFMASQLGCDLNREMDVLPERLPEPHATDAALPACPKCGGKLSFNSTHDVSALRTTWNTLCPAKCGWRYSHEGTRHGFIEEVNKAAEGWKAPDADSVEG